jgi:hypothetical protein
MRVGLEKKRSDPNSQFLDVLICVNQDPEGGTPETSKRVHNATDFGFLPTCWK